MHAVTAARRFPALAVVVGAHALALAFLLELTRTHPTGRSAEESLTLIALLPAAPRESPRLPPAISPGAAPGELTFARPGVTRPTDTRPTEPGAAPADTGPAAIDWAAEGAEAASRVAGGVVYRQGSGTWPQCGALTMRRKLSPGAVAAACVAALTASGIQTVARSAR